MTVHCTPSLVSSNLGSFLLSQFPHCISDTIFISDHSIQFCPDPYFSSIEREAELYNYEREIRWSQKKRLLTSVFIVAVLLFLYVYFDSKNSGESALEYGSRSLRKLGSSYLGGDEDSDLGGKQDVSSVKFGLDDPEDRITPNSFPVRVSAS